MATVTVSEQSAGSVKPRPDLRTGYTVRVHEKIKEGGKERIQVFEGLIIAMHHGKVPTDTTFTVRRIVGGIGVEKVFSLHSPQIAKIEVKKVAKVRRAKLFFLRGRRGKAARLSERFTTAEEFAIAAQNQDSSQSSESGTGQAAQEDEKVEDDEVDGEVDKGTEGTEGANEVEEDVKETKEVKEEKEESKE